MNYFFIEIKKLYKNKIVFITLSVMLFIAFLNPVFQKLSSIRYQHSSANQYGGAFSYWILQPNSLIGHTVYFAMFLVLPVLLTGLVYHSENNSSFLTLSMTKISRKKYFITKELSLLLVTFFNVFIFLTLNLLVTAIFFPANTSQADAVIQYEPKMGSFAYIFFQKSPITMAVIYNFLNSFVISLLSVIALNIQMILKFINSFLAFLIPTLLFQIVSFASTIILPAKYQLNYIVQPVAASVGSEIVTSSDLIIILSIYLIIAFLLFVIGYKRNEDII